MVYFPSFQVNKIQSTFYLDLQDEARNVFLSVLVSLLPHANLSLSLSPLDVVSEKGYSFRQSRFNCIINLFRVSSVVR